MKSTLEALVISFVVLISQSASAKDIVSVTLGATGRYKLEVHDKSKVVEVKIELYPPQKNHPAISIGGFNAIKNLLIVVDSKNIAVPLSCFARFDVDRLLFEQHGGDWYLIFEGGDGAESYEYQIKFDSKDVLLCKYSSRKSRAWTTPDRERYKRLAKTKN